MGFYATNEDKAIALAQQQRNDGWSNADIHEYWTLLEDESFANWILKNLH